MGDDRSGQCQAGEGEEAEADGGEEAVFGFGGGDRAKTEESRARDPGGRAHQDPDQQEKEHKYCSTLVDLAEFSGDALAVGLLDGEGPLQRDGLGRVAEFVVAGLVAEGGFDREVVPGCEQGGEFVGLGDGEIAFEAELAFKDRSRFLDGGQVQGSGFGVDGVEGEPGFRFRDLPINGDVGRLHAGGIDVHAFGQVDFQGEADAAATEDGLVAGPVGELQVFGFDFGAGGACDVVDTLENGSGGEALAVVILEEF